jgi:hypothetical protein
MGCKYTSLVCNTDKNWRLDFKIDEIDVEKIRMLLLKEIVILHKNDKENRYCLVIRTRFHNPGAQTLEDMI